MSAGDQKISIEHLSGAEYSLHHLCIFTVKVEDTYTVYFKHISPKKMAELKFGVTSTMARQKLANYLIHELHRATRIRTFRSVEPVKD
jgi:hypothetical protein